MKRHEINQKYTHHRGRANGHVQSKLLAIACRFDEDTFEWLQKTAERKGISTAEVIRRCVHIARKAVEQ
jgi:predicted ATPase with chaperone activity